MKIIHLRSGKEIRLSENDTVSCAIGNFDGVHLGHRALISAAAKKTGGCTKSAVFTFSEPSSKEMSGAHLITAPKERFSYFLKLGIDIVFLEDFAAVRELSAEDFVRCVLFEKCHVRNTVCGFNFRYGKGAMGTAETLKSDMESLGGKAVIIPPYRMGESVVSSTEIRAALERGDVTTAKEMLGRPYALTAEVLHGKKLGRTLGFPTANQKFPLGRQIPRFGVYAVAVEADGAFYTGVANVGVRPTVENTEEGNVETHLFHFDGDLYGKTVTTYFYKFLRPEQKFADVHELKSAVDADILKAKSFFQEEKL